MRPSRSTLRDYAVPAAVYATALGLILTALITFDMERQDQARTAVQERTAMGGQFITQQVDDLVRRSVLLGEHVFAKPRSSSEELEAMVRGLGLQAAALFSDKGQPIRRTTQFSGVLGDGLVMDLWSRVSNGLQPIGLVRQQTGPTVLAYLTPISTPAGPRIFGGVVKADDNALGRYLDQGIAPEGAVAVLVDKFGTAMTASASTAADREPDLTASIGQALAGSRNQIEWAGSTYSLSSTTIPGMEWRLVMATPQAVLDPAVSAVRTAMWSLAGAMAMLGLVFVRMAGLSRRSKRDLAASSAQLQQANGELETANQRVSELIEMVSHDVQQPLGVIIGYTELALDESDPATRQSQLTRVTQAARSAQRLLDDTLAVTLSESGQVVPSPAEVDLDHLVAEAADSLTGHLRPDVVIVNCPVRVWADPGHLRQVVGNLISNCLKYGDAPITITAHHDNGAVSMVVTDSGPGVAASFVPRLFERYTRDRRTDAAGSGLGLAIVRDLLRANGGDIRYQQGIGATFVLTLPAAPTEQGRLQGASDPRSLAKAG